MKQGNGNLNNGTNMVTTQKKKLKKTTTAVIVLSLSCVLILGSLYAFFSDKLTGAGGKVVAGTLDIVEGESDSKGYIVKRWVGSDWADFSLETDVLNPGDYVAIFADVKNAGQKSAWLRSEIKFDFANTLGDGGEHSEALQNSIKYYSNEVTPEMDPSSKDAKEVEIQEFLDTTTDTKATIYKNVLGVLNGSKEPESGALATNNGVYDEPIMTIVFDADTTNEAQELPIDIKLSWEALQYRNNTTLDANSWDNIQLKE